MHKIASVIISNSTRQFDKEYHYIVPSSLIYQIKPGIRAIVPFGKSNRPVEAYVFRVLDTLAIEGLKEIKSVIDQVPVLFPEMLDLSLWMKNKYICTYFDAIKCMMPSGISVKSLRIVQLKTQDSGLSKSAKIIVDKLSEMDNECEYDELKLLVGLKTFTKTIKSLEEAGIINIYEEYSTRVREKTVRVAYLVRPQEEILDEINSSRVKRIQHIRILEILLENEYISVPDLVRFAGVSSGVLDTLKKYGYIEFKNIEVKRDPLKAKSISRTEPLEPTSEQSQVLSRVKEQMDNEVFEEFLLHGVTGSGKTEVYLQLIQHCFQKGKTAIVLVPEISLTPQMVERFKGRFGDDVAVLHSRLSLGERYDQWRLIRDGKIKVVVGARSAIFVPFQNLGIVIIDEEHENTYKSEITPKYHARDIARERCRYHHAVLLCGSATPSVETYYAAIEKRIQLLEMTTRPKNSILPKVSIVDMRNELEEGNRSIFSKKLALEIAENIKLQQQTILFLNRRGHSSFVLCRNCGYTMRCTNCDISMTYHIQDQRLICHYCGYTIKSPETCPKCKSHYIRHFGTGTQKVEEEIKKQFSGCSALRMDMDTTSYKNSHEEILTEFREKNINVLIGTQMIAKGHDFPNVTLVGVLAADSLLNLGDYRASEKTFQLITQVAGRAGRGELLGRVVIQTYNTEDFSILSACNHDYKAFYSQEIKMREKLNYPPFTNIAILILSGVMDKEVFSQSKVVREQLLNHFGEYAANADILGPARSPLSKIKNKYRWRIVIKYHELDRLINVLSKVSDEFYKKKEKNTIELSVDINPFNML